MSKSRAEGRVLFYGTENLGWKTMSAALRAATPELAPFDAVHVDSGKRSAAPIQRSIRTAPLTRDVVLRADRSFRRRRIMLEEKLDGLGHFDHVHCFGHLTAVPELFAERDLTYSVTTDATWAQASREIYRKHNRPAAERLLRRREAEPDVFREATFVSCTSQWAADSVTREFGVAPEQVFVDPFPVLPGHDYQRRDDASWITFVGNEFARKGGDRLLAWHQDHLADLAELHVVSAAEPPAAARSARNVVWHGQVPNESVRRDILPRTRVVALPTFIDLSPLALIEAAAAGVPIVATRIGGIPELVIHEETGLLADRDDEHALIESLRRAISDDELNQRFGAAARQHYLDHLDANVTLRRLFGRIAAVADPS